MLHALGSQGSQVGPLPACRRWFPPRLLVLLQGSLWAVFGRSRVQPVWALCSVRAGSQVPLLGRWGCGFVSVPQVLLLGRCALGNGCARSQGDRRVRYWSEVVVLLLVVVVVVGRAVPSVQVPGSVHSLGQWAVETWWSPVSLRK